jgi:hypothetical protein
MEHPQTILWRSLVYPGHEFCRLFQADTKWHLEGMAVFTYELKPCRLSYTVICDDGWSTRSAKVEGWVGQDGVYLQLEVDENQRWWLNGDEVPEVRGCTDLDLNFSPSTNTNPIRRLRLPAGEAIEVKAAWLRFPGLHLEALDQVYTRLDEGVIRYMSAGGSFVADLRVNPGGFVVDYPGVWTSESVSGG